MRKRLPAGSRLLDELERIRMEFGGSHSGHKLQLLRALEARRLARAGEVRRLHEILCFLRAYPDGPALLGQVEGMLARFERRADLRRFRLALIDSGIAGTAIRYPFFQPTASWLARRWPKALHIDWPEFADADKLEGALGLMILWAETPAFDELAYPIREWIRKLKGPGETDATFLVRRFDALPMGAALRELYYEQHDIPLRLEPGPGTPSRTRARWRDAPVHYQRRPLRRERPKLWADIEKPPLSIRAVSERRGGELIELARETMVTHGRDLDAFIHGDPRDVRIVDSGDGLQFAAIGVRPERRLLLEAFYGFLTLKNGIPIGYFGASALFRSSEVAFNQFETWRGAEAAHIYGRVLSMLRALFRVDTICAYAYQLGHQNPEGLKSGSWWFYQKLGFRAKDPEVLRIMRQELERMHRRPSHRTSLATLKRLARENVYLHKGAARDDVIGVFPLERVGECVVKLVAERFGSARERGARALCGEAAARLGARGWERLPPGERLAFERWSPFVTILPGVENWSAAEKRACYATVRAKGGRRESDYVRLFDRHAALRRALKKLVE